jgi:hypothetical protein
MDATVLSTEVRRLLDQGIETLRWCQQHTGERGVSEKLQMHVISVAAVTLALNYAADGQLTKALDALDHGDWWSVATYQFEERPE